MAAKAAHEAARARAAREKKILAFLALPLVLALYFAYHTVSKLHHSGAPITPAVAEAPASTTPGTTTPTGTTAATGAPAAPAAVTPGIVFASNTGTLDSLGRLASKDPFHDGGPRLTSATAGSSTKTKKPAKHASKKHSGGTKKINVPLTTAIISVNRQLTSVSLGSDFPATNDPSTNGIFRLVSISAKSAKISVVGGSYASGAHTLTLTVGVVVTLVNTADGVRYRLELFPPGTPAAAVAAPSSTTTTTGTTTTTSGP